jgi:hypothetical protein
LDHGYPKDSALTFVANHFTLPKNERFILNRAAFSKNEVSLITKGRIDNPENLRDQPFHIDFYNQYTTFQSLLDNEPIICCRDGFLRDLFSLFHSKRDLRLNSKPMEQFILSIVKLNPSFLILYLDQQRSNSATHAEMLQRIMNRNDILGQCIVTRSVDHQLKISKTGITFSHDSFILREVKFSFDYIDWYIKNKNFKTDLTNQLLDFHTKEER